jgi:hypothetical protein
MPTRRQDGLAPFIIPDDTRKVPDSYGVFLKDGYTLDQHFKFIGVDLGSVAKNCHFFYLLNGYACEIADASIVQDKIRRDPGVQSVEQNTFIDAVMPGEESSDDNTTPDPDPDKDADHFSLLGWYKTTYTGLFPQVEVTYGKKHEDPQDPGTGRGFYDWDSINNPGMGVEIYVLDTGIRVDHVGFRRGVLGFRARHFQGLSDNSPSPYVSENMVRAVPVCYTQILQLED